MEWIIGGLNLPLPDALPDKRIYDLLKTVDLENLTFSDFQGVAKTIYAEQGAEDELRRIVLLNLARLAVKGNWVGLTSSGGGSSTVTQSPEPISGQITATYPYFSPTDMYKLAKIDNTTKQLEATAQFFRFVAPKTGTLASMTIRTESNQSGIDDAIIGIYDTTSEGWPKDKLGQVQIDVNGGAGLYTSTSWSSSVSLTAGTTYWIAFVSEGSAMPTLSQQAGGDEHLSLGMTHYPGTPYSVVWNNSGTNYSLPSTLTLSNTSLQRQAFPSWAVKYS